MGSTEVMFKRMTGSEREAIWLVEEPVEEQEVGHKQGNQSAGAV